MAPRPRHRPWLAALLLGVVALGLASRQVPGLFPAVLGNYPGDALWALMVFLGIAWLRPGARPLAVAGCALAVSYAVELSQRCQQPWLQAVRGTPLGHLVLGSGFDWIDLVAYTVGIALGLAADLAFAAFCRRTP